ncbi:hypothetical protein A1F99_055090 [Pyrenophora tritici-repentis]|nr:hypothetical protein A1F99_055090 [Pyrenophora tritici-repentis]
MRLFIVTLLALVAPISGQTCRGGDVSPCPTSCTKMCWDSAKVGFNSVPGSCHKNEPGEAAKTGREYQCK